MAISASTMLELRVTGADTNSGGFVTGASGTDYSQQDAAQFSGTDLVIDGTTNTKVTSAAHTFTSADVGNLINISAGASWTTGFYQVVSVAAGAATLDRSPGATSLTGGTWALGGALLTFSKAISAMTVSGIVCWVKSGTYSSVAVTWPSLTAGTAYTRLVGYTSTRGDLPGVGARPIWRASSGIQLLSGGSNSNTGVIIENIDFDGNNTGTVGITLFAQQLAYNCIFRRFTGFRAVLFSSGTGNGAGGLLHCEIANNATSAAAVQISANTGFLESCYIHDNSCAAVTVGGSGAYISLERCVIANNTGASSDGISVSGNSGPTIRNCSIYGNGRDGIRFATTNIYQNTLNCSNNILVGNSGYGINVTSAPTPLLDFIGIRNNAYYNNTSGARNNLNAGVGDVTLTGVPFTNAGSGDFSLNSTASQGAACRAAGFPGALIAGGTGYLDIGALQHQDSGGGSTYVINQIINRTVVNEGEY